ncbi:MAG: hypothetical protein AAGA29_07785 [Planctomycetota bacterium]
MADPKPIKQRIEVDDQASPEVRRIADEMEQLNRVNKDGAEVTEDATRVTRDQTDAVQQQRRATDQQAEAQQLANLAVGTATRALGGLAAGFVGVDGLLNLYDQWIERIESASERLKENASIARENAESRLDLIALQGVETEEQLNEINLISSFAGRRPGEVAQTLTLATSQLPNTSKDDINELVLAAAGIARTSTAPLPELLTGVLPAFRETGDAELSANLFISAIREAGEADPGQLGQVIGENLKLNQAFAGTDTGQTVGLIAAATGVGLESRPAATALNAVNFALRGQGTPGGQETLQRLNIDRSNVLTALEQLVDARERGELSLADIETLGGKEAAGLFAILSDRATLEDFIGKVQRVDAAEDFQGSLAQEAASSIFTPGSIQSSNLLAKQFEVEEENIRSTDRRAARTDSFRSGLSALLAAELAKPNGGDFNITPNLAESIKTEFDFQLGRGLSPEEALRIAERVPRVSLGVGPFDRIGGQQVNGGTSSDAVNRAGLFSDPLPVVINQGVTDNPELLVDRAEAVRQKVTEAIIEEFGEDIRLRALDRDRYRRLPEVRERALRPSLDDLPPDVRQRQEEINRRDEELLQQYRDSQSLAPSKQPVPAKDQYDLAIDPAPVIDDPRVASAPRILNQGTLIINSGDPLVDDLDGRDRLV